MTYAGGIFAKYTGSWARNSASALRRAFCTASWSDAGLIGRISDSRSSLASASAMIFRNSLPRLRPITSRKALIETLINTASALGSGSSPDSDATCCTKHCDGHSPCRGLKGLGFLGVQHGWAGLLVHPGAVAAFSGVSRTTGSV